MALGSIQNNRNLLNTITLFKSIRIGNLDMLEKVLTLDVDINAIDEETGETPLHLALNLAVKNSYASNSTVIVNKLLDLGADVNAVNERTGETPLHIAVKQCNNPLSTTIVQRLIELGADINKTDNAGKNPLFTLISFVNPPNSVAETAVADCTRLLVKSNADIYAKDNSGLSSMDLAFSSTWKKIVRKILVEDSPLFKPDSTYTLLELATKHHIVPIQSLLKDPGTINDLDASGKSLLHYAALAWRKDLIELLVKDFGSYVDIQDLNGNTPLHLAAMNCLWATDSKEIIDNVVIPLKLLGADLNKTNKYGKTPEQVTPEKPQDPATLFRTFGFSSIKPVITNVPELNKFSEIATSQLFRISVLCKSLLNNKIDFINSNFSYSESRKNRAILSINSFKNNFDNIIKDIIYDINHNYHDYEQLKHIVRHVNYVKFCYNLNKTDGASGGAIWELDRIPKNIHGKLKNLTYIIQNIKSMTNRSIEAQAVRDKLSSKISSPIDLASKNLSI